MRNNNTTCRTCGEKTLEPHVFSISIPYSGTELTVSNLSSYRCKSCDSEIVLTEQIRINDKKILDAKRKSRGLLTSVEILAGRKQLRLSQSSAACVFGGGANAFSKYERGEVMQSEAMDKLLRLTINNPSLIKTLEGNLDCNFSNISSAKFPNTNRNPSFGVVSYTARVGELTTRLKASNQRVEKDDAVAA